MAKDLSLVHADAAEDNRMSHSYRLFIDDMRPIPAGWLGARTVSEAIAVLANLPIREVSLDHDIIFPRTGNDLYQALSNENFKGVAYYIAAMPDADRPKVRIHTANAGAARAMCDILRLPFEGTYQFYSEGSYE